MRENELKISPVAMERNSMLILLTKSSKNIYFLPNLPYLDHRLALFFYLTLSIITYLQLIHNLIYYIIIFRKKNTKYQYTLIADPKEQRRRQDSFLLEVVV